MNFPLYLFLSLISICGSVVLIVLASWALASMWFLLALCRAAIRKNQPERRDEDAANPILDPKRGGSECRPVAQFSLNQTVRWNPKFLVL